MAGSILDESVRLWLEQLYRAADNCWQLYQHIRKSARLTTGGTVAWKVERLNVQLRFEEEAFARCNQSQSDREEFERITGPYRQAILHLEDIARRSFFESCIDGFTLGIGYTNPSDPCLVVIPPNQWAFLDDLDFKTGNAGPYRAIRMIDIGEAEENEWFEFVKLVTNPETIRALVLQKTQDVNDGKADITKEPDYTHQSRTTEENKCKEWLISLMQNNTTPEKSKSKYEEEAKNKFRVGSRAFIRAWDGSIEETGNLNWRKPGRKPKS